MNEQIIIGKTLRITVLLDFEDLPNGVNNQDIKNIAHKFGQCAEMACEDLAEPLLFNIFGSGKLVGTDWDFHSIEDTIVDKDLL